MGCVSEGSTEELRFVVVTEGERVAESDVAVVVFDVGDEASFEGCEKRQDLEGKPVVLVGTKTDTLVTSFALTDLHKRVKAFCEEYSLRYPKLVSAVRDSQEDWKEFLAMLYDVAVHPSTCIPETALQRRRRYERTAVKVTSTVGLVACLVGAAVYFGRNGMKWK